MPKLLPIIAGVTGTTIIGGVGSYFLLTQSTISIKEKFKEAIIDFSNETALIKTKLTNLKAGTIYSDIQKLKDAQTKAKANPATNDDGSTELKEACEEIYKSNFDNKESALFKDFKAYCSWNIKDKMGDKWFDDSKTNWSTKFTKLSQTESKPLSESLKKVTKGDDLKKWCEDIAIELFEGESDLEFKDTQIHCKKEG